MARSMEAVSIETNAGGSRGRNGSQTLQSDACLRALCGKGNSPLRNVFCDPEGARQEDEWAFVGEGLGCYDVVKRYEYVGYGEGNFERNEIVLHSGTCLKTRGLLTCTVLGLILLAYFTGNLVAQLTQGPSARLPVPGLPSGGESCTQLASDAYNCCVQDASARRIWAPAQQSWCCQNKDVACDARSPSAASRSQPRGMTVQVDPAPVAPKPNADSAHAAAHEEHDEHHGPNRCVYDGVVFDANIVQWDPPVWKYTAGIGTCAPMRAGSRTWAQVAFPTEAECMRVCAPHHDGAAGPDDAVTLRDDGAAGPSRRAMDNGAAGPGGAGAASARAVLVAGSTGVAGA